MDSKFHVSLEVADLEKSVAFYSTLFNSPPAKLKPGYAKFDPADPAVVLSLLQPATAPCCVSGLSHLGVRVASLDQVVAARERMQAAGYATRDEMNTTCCYAAQDKLWVTDPTGYRWEVYVFQGDREEMHDAAPVAATGAGACCNEAVSGCCS